MSEDLQQSLLSAADGSSSASIAASQHRTYRSTSSEPHHPSPTPSEPPPASSSSSHLITIPPSFAPPSNPSASSPLVPLYPLTSTSPPSSLPRHLHYRFRALQQPPYPIYPTLSSQWSALSRLSQAFLVLLPLLYPLAFLSSSTRVVACFLPLLLLPSLLFFRLFLTRYPTHCELNTLLTTYILGFTVAAVLVLLLESAVALLAAIPLLYDQLPRIIDALRNRPSPSTTSSTPSDPTADVLAVIDPTPGFFLLLFVLAYISAGGCEEGMKYVLTNRVKRVTPGFRDREGYLLYAVAGALGFSTVENVGYAFQTVTPWYAVMIGVLTRMVISTPIHVACAYLVGVGVVRREVYGERLPLWRILALPVLLHGSFDFSLLLFGVTLEPDTVTLLLVECGVIAVTAMALLVVVRMERRHIAGPPPPLLPTAEEPAAAAAAGGQVSAPARPVGRGEGEMVGLL